MKKSLVCAIFCLFVSASSWAQGVGYFHKETEPGGGDVKNPSIKVCSSGASMIKQPCDLPVTIYTDDTLTVPKANPFRGDANGNYEFHVAAGVYVVSVGVPFVPGYSYKINLVSAGAATPGSPVNSLQANINGGLAGTAGITTPDGGNSLVIKGVDPWADVRAFGAKGVGTTVFPTSTTTTCTAAACTTGAQTYNAGDGITIRGAGAANGMATPGAPTVTPALAITGTVPDAPSLSSVNSPTGASTYLYKVVARDKFGGLTLPSAATTITNGLAALGLNTLTVSSCSRSNQTVSCTTTGTQNLSVGALVHLAGGSNSQFTGYFNLATVNNGSNGFTINLTPMDTRLGAATSETGGTVSYYTANKITWTAVSGSPWQYYICAERPGDVAYSLIGTSAPTSSDYTITSFFDYGSTLLGNQTFPPYVTNSVCTAGSATKDPFTTTVATSDGAGTFTLSSAVTTNVTNATSVYDAAPNILAAVKSIGYTSPAFTGGSIYLPPVPIVGQTYGYPINSYLVIPANIKIIQAGPIIVNETIEIGSNTNWDGGWAVGSSAGTFAFGTWALTYCQYANPCIYSNQPGNGTYENLTLQSFGSNGGTLWLTDSAYQLSWRNVSFDTNQSASTDYIGKGLVNRSATSGGNIYHFDHVSFSGGPNNTSDSSWSPLLYFPIALTSGQAAGATVDAAFVDAHDIFFSHRGIEWDVDGGAYNCNFDWAYRQGGVNPFLTLGNYAGLPAGSCNINHLILDSELQPVIANLSSTNGTVNGVSIKLTQINSNSADLDGRRPPVISGWMPYAVNYDQILGSYTQGAGVATTDLNGTTASVVGATYDFFCPELVAPPSGVAAQDILYCDATAHRWKMLNNNGSADTVVGAATTDAFSNKSVTDKLPFTETTAPSGSAASDIFWADSTAHRPKFNANNAGAETVASTSVTPVNGDCVIWVGTIGKLGDSGSACGAGGAGGMDPNMDNMANPTAMNHSLIPAAMNVVAAGDATHGFTNIFLCTVANQCGSFNTANLTSNRSMNIPDAASTLIRDTPAVSHQFISACALATGACTQAQPTLADLGAGTAAAGLYNFAAGTMQIPQAAGFVALVNSTLGLDTTANAMHGWINSADAVLSGFASAPAGTKCVQSTGTKGLLTEASLACGTWSDASTNTGTNKTLSQEGTGNVITVVASPWMRAAGCNNSTAAPAFDLPVTQAPTPNCLTGTNVQKATLDYDDSVNEFSQFDMALPHTWTGAIDINLKWLVTATGGANAVKWTVQTACSADAATYDTAFNAAQTITTNVAANNIQTVSSQATVTVTGCAIDNVMNFKIGRDTTDTFTGTARLIGAQVILRHTGK